MSDDKQWFRPAAELDTSSRYCTCCQRKLTGIVRMLELDQRNNTYHDFSGVPEDKSQGWFPFGLKCAANKLRLAERALPDLPDLG